MERVTRTGRKLERKIPLDSLRVTHKKMPNWKNPGHDGI